MLTKFSNLKKNRQKCAFFDMNLFSKIKTVSLKMSAKGLNLDFYKLQTICNKPKSFSIFFVGARKNACLGVFLLSSPMR